MTFLYAGLLTKNLMDMCHSLGKLNRSALSGIRTVQDEGYLSEQFL